MVGGGCLGGCRSEEKGPGHSYIHEADKKLTKGRRNPVDGRGGGATLRKEHLGFCCPNGKCTAREP